MICNVLEYLESAKEKFPEKCAFADADRTLSYRQVEDI